MMHRPGHGRFVCPPILEEDAQRAKLPEISGPLPDPDLLRRCIVSLLGEESEVESLDLRGNFLDKEDCMLILRCLESNKTLQTLNGIPVMADEGLAKESLVFDRLGLPRRSSGDEMDYDEPDGCCYGRATIRAAAVRLDEGDGFLFGSLVTPQNFPVLSSISLVGHVLLDTTLTFLCDALLAIPTLEKIQLSDLQLSSRGSALLVSALAELAPRLVALNGVPVARLIEQKKHDAGGGRMGVGTVALPRHVEWNDFSLGVLSRLHLWPYVSWQVVEADDGSDDEVDPAVTPFERLALTHGCVTDTGLRGLCALLRQMLPTDVGRSLDGAPPLRVLDLSRNPQLSDLAVAELSRTIQKIPSSNLREVNVRYCRRLRARSAFELLQLVPKGREQAASNLRVINGVDVYALQAAGKMPTSRAAVAEGNPLVIRIPSSFAMGQGTWLHALSECDAYFFAHILHHFPHIPYCHLHIEVPSANDLPPLECQVFEQHGAVKDVGGHDATSTKLLESPLCRTKQCAGAALDGVSSSGWGSTSVSEGDTTLDFAVQSAIDSACRFFEACPVSTKLHVSIAPRIPGSQNLEDHTDIVMIHSEEEQGQQTGQPLAGGVFSRIRFNLRKQKKRRALEAQPEQDSPRHTPRHSDDEGETPQKPKPKKKAAIVSVPYVNNINAQRNHDCFATLYGEGVAGEVILEHQDIYATHPKNRGFLSADVKVRNLFQVCASVDLQHLHLMPRNLFRPLEAKQIDMSLLTHLNLSYNELKDGGVQALLEALAAASSIVVHIALKGNLIGDDGAAAVASNMPALGLLSSITLADNNITETGAVALAEAIGGSLLHAMPEAMDEAMALAALPMLSVDLAKNRVREVGAMRWAELIALHPHLQFLSLAENEIAYQSDQTFLALVYAASSSPMLSVLDLRKNARGKDLMKGPVDDVPASILEALKHDANLVETEFEEQASQQGVFIRQSAPAPRRAPRVGPVSSGRHAPSGKENVDVDALLAEPLDKSEQSIEDFGLGADDDRLSVG